MSNVEDEPAFRIEHQHGLSRLTRTMFGLRGRAVMRIGDVADMDHRAVDLLHREFVLVVTQMSIDRPIRGRHQIANGPSKIEISVAQRSQERNFVPMGRIKCRA
jgi:hypothetical protein